MFKLQDGYELDLYLINFYKLLLYGEWSIRKHTIRRLFTNKTAWVHIFMKDRN